MPAKNLQGQLAIVTGAGKPNGVGFATARLLAEHGADVSTSLIAQQDRHLLAARSLSTTTAARTPPSKT